MANAKWTAEQKIEVIDLYEKGDSVEAIADHVNRTTKAVRAILVQANVYVKQEKPTSTAKREGPSKKEMLKTLKAIWQAAPVEGLQNATKEAIQDLINFVLMNQMAQDESDETESDETESDETESEAA
jgi:transposase-like protein